MWDGKASSLSRWDFWRPQFWSPKKSLLGGCPKLGILLLQQVTSCLVQQSKVRVVAKQVIYLAVGDVATTPQKHSPTCNGSSQTQPSVDKLSLYRISWCLRFLGIKSWRSIGYQDQVQISMRDKLIRIVNIEKSHRKWQRLVENVCFGH